MLVVDHLWLWGSVLLTALCVVRGQDRNCDFNQVIAAGTTYYVYSPGYPNNYPRSKTCRWQATCPANMQCRLNCPIISMPATASCTGDRLLVSKTGASNLAGADNYCGTGTLDVTSTVNRISIGLVTLPTSPGGRFSCTLTAVAPAPSCSCGWKKTNRIVGGQETGINEYPSMAGLVDNTLRIIACGGVIITSRHVLTAAHCFDGQTVPNLSVLYGDHNVKIGTETTAATLVKSQQLIKHPSYRQNSYDYDIGIVVTASTIVFSDRVGPACLPFRYTTSTFENNYVDVLGWGTTSFAGASSDFLRKVQLQVTSSTSCTSTMGSVVTPRIMCTYTAGKDACQRDSGGPLLWFNPSNGRLYAVGVIIGGFGCATSRPGLNARVTSVLPWISSTIAGATVCNV